MCRCNRCDIAFQMARRLSDQDIMPRYRMTPPVRGRCPPRATRSVQPALERAEANGRGANSLLFAARPLAGADVESTELAPTCPLNLLDLVVKTSGLWSGSREWTTRTYCNSV